MKEQIHKYSIDNLIIVSFCNYKYREITLNWVSYLNKHNIKNYIIIATDQLVHEYLKENSINTILNTTWDGSKKEWNLRLKVIYEIIFLGFDVLHSDLDAIWVKNPLKFIDNKYDLIASTGTFPINISKKLGFSLCMGWMYFRHTKRILSVLANTLSVDRNFDDQKRFNNVLFGNSGLRDVKQIGPGISQINTKDLKIKILDEGIVSRENDNINAFVRHPLCSQFDKVTIFKKLKLWNI